MSKLACGDCLAAISDKSTIQQRMQVAANAFNRLTTLNERLDELRTLVTQDPGCASAINAAATTLTFDAEAHVRAALNVGLDTFNELRNSGVFAGYLAQVPHMDLPTNTLVNAFSGFAADFPKTFPGVSPAVFHFGAKYFQDNAVSARIDAGILTVKWTPQGSTTPAQLRLATADPKVSLATIPAADFFDPKTVAINPTTIAVSDCHRDHPAPLPIPEIPNTYASFIAVLIGARDKMYTYARRVQYYGLGGPEGGQIGAVVGVIIAIAVAIASLIASIYYGVECATHGGDFGTPGSNCFQAFLSLLGIGIFVGLAFAAAGGLVQFNKQQTMAVSVS